MKFNIEKYWTEIHVEIKFEIRHRINSEIFLTETRIEVRFEINSTSNKLFDRYLIESVS